MARPGLPCVHGWLACEERDGRIGWTTHPTIPPSTQQPSLLTDNSWGWLIVLISDVQKMIYLLQWAQALLFCLSHPFLPAMPSISPQLQLEPASNFKILVMPPHPRPTFSTKATVLGPLKETSKFSISPLRKLSQNRTLSVPRTVPPWSFLRPWRPSLCFFDTFVAGL